MRGDCQHNNNNPIHTSYSNVITHIHELMYFAPYLSTRLFVYGRLSCYAFQSTQSLVFIIIYQHTPMYTHTLYTMIRYYLFSSHKYFLLPNTVLPNTLISSVRVTVVINLSLHYLPCVYHYSIYSYSHNVIIINYGVT